MQYLKTKGDMFQKYQALYNMLDGQVQVLKGVIGEALARYDTEGDNEKQLINGFFTLIEAIEQVDAVQRTIKGETRLTELAAFLKKTKEAFKALDMAMMKEDEKTEAAIKKAMDEKQQATIH